MPQIRYKGLVISYSKYLFQRSSPFATHPTFAIHILPARYGPQALSPDHSHNVDQTNQLRTCVDPRYYPGDG